jgi:hypothetical protein
LPEGVPAPPGVPSREVGSRLGSRAFQAIIADRLDRAFFHGGAGGSLGWAFGLVESETAALGVVPLQA